MGGDLYHSQRRSSVEVNQHHHPNHLKGLNHHGSQKYHLVKSFLNKKGNLSQHNLTSTKNTFSGDCTNASVKTCASFGNKPFSERGNRKLSTSWKTAAFFRKLENSGERLKNIRMGIWVKNRRSGGTISRKSSTPDSNVNARVRINQPRGRGNVEKRGHSPSSLKGESISKQLVSSSKTGWGGTGLLSI